MLPYFIVEVVMYCYIIQSAPYAVNPSIRLPSCRMYMHTFLLCFVGRVKYTCK